MRSTIDRFVAVVARLIARGLFRSVEVVGFDRLPEGPRLIVANHFNGFVDPVVLTGAYGRLPRFIAKGTLWRTPGVPLIMRVVGVLAVHRQVDGGGDNAGTFSTVVAELHRGHAVAIFPEGTTHDHQRLAPVRTGAARLALDAAADGVEGLHVLPVGITFEDKVALRSRLVIRAGTPIDPAGAAYRDGTGTPLGTDDHDAVRRLNEEIRSGLAAVSPDFDSLLDAVEMRGAADLVLRTERGRPLAEVPLAEREALASELDDLAPEARSEIGAAVAEHHLLLAAVGVRDDHLVPRVGVRALVTRLVLTVALVLVLLPFALMGAAANVVPAALVALAGAVATAPVSKGTNRVLVGVVAFPAAWALLAVGDVGSDWVATAASWATSPLSPVISLLFGGRDGWGSSLLVFLAAPALGLLAVWLLERVAMLHRTWRAVRSNLARRGQLAELLEHRAATLARIEALRRPPSAPTG